METRKDEVTDLLHAVRAGDKAALDKLFELLYTEFHDLAHIIHKKYGGGETLNTTALVHEAYAKLVDAARITAQERRQFYALFCKVIRHLIVDYARKAKAEIRGGDQERVPLEKATLVSDEDEKRMEELLALDKGILALENYESRLAEVVDLSYFGGFTAEKIAEIVGTSERTVERDLSRARALLGDYLRGDP